MKTAPMSQQSEALRCLDGKKYFALLMEQGTGKSYSLLSDAERLFATEKIDALLVIAPNGVHTNWIRREIPTHLSDPYIARAWSTGMNKARRAAMDDLITLEAGKQPPLRILAMSYDSLNTKEGFDFASYFMSCTKCLYVLDESQYIKNGKAARTKQVFKLKAKSVGRRILTGTPLDKPGDVFSQMEFLHEGLLGTSSYRAFMSEFTQLCDAKNPVTDSDWAFRKQIQKNPRMAFANIIAKDDATGMPIYRNLDKLRKLIEPYSYRVLKRDCLDLPEKVYQSVYFELPPDQRAAYQLMENELRIQLEDGSLSPVAALASLVKLQQITSGYVVVPKRDELLYVGSNARLEALQVALEPLDGQSVIIWARFREEIRSIVEAMKGMGRKVVEYHGGIKEEDRENAVDSFQSGAADTFVGNPQAGGIGLTLTAAEYAIYYSNDFSMLRRKQSEDRNHRIGTKNKAIYIDLVASNSIDESITKSLQWKSDLASTILGDRKLNFSATALMEG